MNLFDFQWPKHFGDEFKVTLNHPLYISDNIFAAKEHGKRVLLEMVDLHPKLTLAYSGGMDSGFILCCIRDLIDEGKITEDRIEIMQGIFTGGDVILTADNERATKFANSLGFSPRIHKFDIHEKWKEIENFYLDYKVGGRASFAVACQHLIAMEQDSVIISNRHHTWSGISNNSCFTLSSCILHQIDNMINFRTWDSDSYSSYITPFKINCRKVNMQPYDIASPENKFWKDSSGWDYVSIFQTRLSLQFFEETFPKLMIYLQCYPKMMEILGKFVTIDWVIWEQHCSHDEISRLRMFDEMPETFGMIRFPNGELVTKEHLLNYDEMKEGEK